MLTLLGAAVYFLLFPGTFSTDNQMYAMLLPAAEQAGISIGVFVAVYYVSAAVSGGFVNMFFALGEEIGWTGYLVPALTSHVGEKKAVLLRGVIWIPALGHGVLNAVAGFPIAFLAEGTTGYLFGPTIAGSIAGIPLFLLAIVLFKQFDP